MPLEHAVHPVTTIRIGYVFAIVVSFMLPWATGRNFQGNTTCMVLVDSITEFWTKVCNFCVLVLCADVLGYLALASDKRVRWWGKREKVVTRILSWCLWILTVYGLYIYFSAGQESKFHCFSPAYLGAVFLLFVYGLILPLWVVLVTCGDTRSEGRYLSQDDLDDEIEEMQESPKAFQVWRNGRLIYASVSKGDIKKWVLDPKNLKKGEWSNTVIREIQL